MHQKIKQQIQWSQPRRARNENLQNPPREMSPSAECDNPFPLGKCRFPVLRMSFSKYDIRTMSEHQKTKSPNQNRKQFFSSRNVESLVPERGFLDGAISSRICPGERKRSHGPKSQHFHANVLKMSFPCPFWEKTTRTTPIVAKPTRERRKNP
jgi:hypothetical protein